MLTRARRRVFLFDGEWFVDDHPELAKVRNDIFRPEVHGPYRSWREALTRALR